MGILRRIEESLQKSARRRAFTLLRTIDPAALVKVSEEGALATFKRAYRRVPSYRALIDASGFDPAGVTDIGSFIRHLPLLDKEKTFRSHPLHELCLDGNLDEVKSVLTSSGHSGIFSFGVNTYRNLRDSSRSIDLGLDFSFNISGRRSLLINCLPMGVKVHTSLTIAETSVREDMVWAVIATFSRHFDQTILVGEGSFLKKIVEEGARHGVDWRSSVFHLVTGEEGIAENYRDYIAGLLGTDPETWRHGMIGSSMGVAELDLNIFHETKDTIVIRRKCHRDPALRAALFGADATVCPMLFVYYPHRCFVEEIPSPKALQPEIVISMLSPHMKIPLLRYKTGDLGRIIPYGKLCQTLDEFGLGALHPELKLPLIAIYGRGGYCPVGTRRLYPEEVKEAIYADPAIASSVTGAFKLVADPERSSAKIELQLKPGSVKAPDLEERLHRALLTYNDAPVSISFYPYASFPHFMEVDYERKFSYV